MARDLSSIINILDSRIQKYKYIIVETCNQNDLYYGWRIYHSNEVEKVKKLLKGCETLKAIWLSNSKLIPLLKEFLKCGNNVECYKSLGSIAGESYSESKISIGLHDSEKNVYSYGDDYVPTFVGYEIAERTSWWGIRWLARPDVLDNTALLWENKANIPETLCNECDEYGCQDPEEVIYYEEIRYENDCQHRDCVFITARFEDTGIYVEYKRKRWLTSGLETEYDEFYVDFTGDLKIDTEYNEYEHHYYRNGCCGKVSESEYEIVDGKIVFDREN